MFHKPAYTRRRFILRVKFNFRGGYPYFRNLKRFPPRAGDHFSFRAVEYSFVLKYPHVAKGLYSFIFFFIL